MDEQHYPLPTTAYALSKVLGETMAEHVSAWSGMPIVGLRLSNVHEPADYLKIPGYWSDPLLRVFNLWATSTSGTPRRPAGGHWTRR